MPNLLCFPETTATPTIQAEQQQPRKQNTKRQKQGNKLSQQQYVRMQQRDVQGTGFQQPTQQCIPQDIQQDMRLHFAASQQHQQPQQGERPTNEFSFQPGNPVPACVPPSWAGPDTVGPADNLFGSQPNNSQDISPISPPKHQGKLQHQPKNQHKRQKQQQQQQQQQQQKQTYQQQQSHAAAPNCATHFREGLPPTQSVECDSQHIQFRMMAQQHQLHQLQKLQQLQQQTNMQQPQQQLLLQQQHSMQQRLQQSIMQPQQSLQPQATLREPAVFSPNPNSTSVHGSQNLPTYAQQPRIADSTGGQGPYQPKPLQAQNQPQNQPPLLVADGVPISLPCVVCKTASAKPGCDPCVRPCCHVVIVSTRLFLSAVCNSNFCKGLSGEC